VTAQRLKWDSLLGCPRKAVAARFLLMCAAVGVAAQPLLLPGSGALAQQKSRAVSRSKPARDLHEIGVVIAKTVLDKNIERLLAYDRADLRAPDKVSLNNPKSDLYCYIFDSDCITWGDGTWRSVYEKLSEAHPLEIKVILSSSPYDRQLYGSVFFYDPSAIAGKDLRSSDYVCKEGPAKIAAWKFRLEKGKWKPVTPLFNSETWGPCPNEVQGNG
jgi:hypothetical protein